jgi:hypothetical protein
MGYRLDGRGTTPRKGKRFSFIPQLPDRLSGTPNLISNRYGGTFSPGLKQPGCSPPSSADVKNGGAIPPLPLRLYGVVLN